MDFLAALAYRAALPLNRQELPQSNISRLDP